MAKVFIFDVESTGLIKKKGKGLDNYYDYTNLDIYDSSRLVSICWKIFNQEGHSITGKYYIVKPKDFIIDNDSDATKIHNITSEIASNGTDIEQIFKSLEEDLEGVGLIVAHNVAFDIRILCSELYRYKYLDTCQRVSTTPTYCTCRNGELITKIKPPGWRHYKIPKLSELYMYLFEEEFNNAHNAEADVNACARCYFQMIK